MCWIDESYWNGGCIRHYFDPERYNADLTAYRELIASFAGTVRSGCLVPPNPALQSVVPGITPVLPQGYVYDILNPPAGISVEKCSRPPTANELFDDFDRIREGLVPDGIILSVDNSGSMYTSDIQTGYGEFKTAIKAAYPDARFVERDNCDVVPPGCFRGRGHL